MSFAQLMSDRRTGSLDKDEDDEDDEDDGGCTGGGDVFKE